MASDSNWGTYLGLGLEMAVGVGLGYLVGNWLDNKFGWGDRGMITGTLLGVAGGMYLLIKTALAANRDEENRK